MAAPEPSFPDFDILTHPYKRVGNHDILAGVFIPKGLQAADGKKRPLIVRFHGGLLVTGGYQHFFTTWLQAYAVQHSAVVVSADFRLLLESDGLDMMDDLGHLWGWVLNGGLQAFLGERVVVDLERILIKGDSAGGYLAIQSALTLGNRARALMATYPPADLKIPWFTTAFERSMFGFPMYPADTISQHLLSLKTKNGDSLSSSTIVTNVAPPARFNLGFSAVQQGKLVDLLGSDPRLFPMERLLDRGDVKSLPSILILHGREDSVIPFESSEAFVRRVREVFPAVKTHYRAVEGCEHGLDKFETLETPWLREGLEFVTPLWLE